MREVKGCKVRKTKKKKKKKGGGAEDERTDG
jgi:hypothetical protein